MNGKIIEKYVALATTNSSRKKRRKRRTKKRQGRGRRMRKGQT
jgi:hypothetical protein